jgi:hypothetical protein
MVRPPWGVKNGRTRGRERAGLARLPAPHYRGRSRGSALRPRRAPWTPLAIPDLILHPPRRDGQPRPGAENGKKGANLSKNEPLLLVRAIERLAGSAEKSLSQIASRPVDESVEPNNRFESNR